MKTKIVFLLMMTLMIGGCLDLDLSDIVSEMDFLPGVSVHQYYDQNDIVFEEKLLGSWGDKKSGCRFEKTEEEKSYYMLFKDDDKTRGKFEAVLFKLEDMLFLDIRPAKMDVNEVEMQRFLLVPTHAIIKINQIEPELKIQMPPDPDMINSLKHEKVGDDGLLITASTEELQEFIKKHAKDEDFFRDEENLGHKLK